MKKITDIFGMTEARKQVIEARTHLYLGLLCFLELTRQVRAAVRCLYVQQRSKSLWLSLRLLEDHLVRPAQCERTFSCWGSPHHLDGSYRIFSAAQMLQITDISAALPLGQPLAYNPLHCAQIGPPERTESFKPKVNWTVIPLCWKPVVLLVSIRSI